MRGVLLASVFALASLSATQARAADPPPPSPAPLALAPTPGRNWTGFYLGLHAGGAWGRDRWASGDGFLAEAAANGAFPGEGEPTGLLGGGQVGFNQQMGPWVAGVEASASASNLGGYAKCVMSDPAEPSSFACHNTVDSIVTLSGRLGRGWGDFLLYGKAGAARATGSSQMFPTLSTTRYTSRGTRSGWVLGGGLEYPISRTLSGFIEYDHYDFGAPGLTYSGGGQSATVRFNERLDAVRLGVNYHFARGDGRDASPPLTLPGLPTGWTTEIGARYFIDAGRMQFDLMDPVVTAHLNSRLIYSGATGQSLETFFRFENRNGLFLKGYAGQGAQAHGALNDEDFPGATHYSNTHSGLRGGELAYGAIDLGHELIRQGPNTLGVFVGYRVLHQRANAFGCRQLASDEICAPEQAVDYPVLLGSLGLSQAETWQGVALGLNARLRLSRRWRLELDPAYLPYADRSGADNHWWRADINPLNQRGHGWGVQMEAVLSYALTERLDLGIGGRYWYFTTDTASTLFPSVTLRSPMAFYSERYGGFLQASYRFGGPRAPGASGPDSGAKAAPAPVNWTGLYVGGAFGAGKGRSAYASPFPPPASGDANQLGGAMAGAQIGGDYQRGAYVLGAEASAGWANLVGADTCFSTIDASTEAGFGCGARVNALATVTGRLGYALGRALLYARGGAAWDRQRDTFNNYNFTGRTISHQGASAGWTLGGGLEYALRPSLSVGLEYRHFEFGAASAFTASAPPLLAGVSLAPKGLRLDTVAVTLNYRFARARGAP